MTCYAKHYPIKPLLKPSVVGAIYTPQTSNEHGGLEVK